MKKTTIAVTGISGVGKTTIISNFIGNNSHILYVRASSLLKEFLSTKDEEELRKISSENIVRNQYYISLAITELRHNHPDQHIIFDGHSLIDNDKETVIVPVEVFEKLSPDIIVFIEDDPDAILKRRIADNTRHRPLRSPEEIFSQQNVAKEIALSYSTTLSVPFFAVRSGDQTAFDSILSENFKRV